MEGIRNFSVQHQLLVLLVNRVVRTWWYDIYTYLSSRGIPYAVLVEVDDRREPSCKTLFKTHKQLFTSILRDKLITTYNSPTEPKIELVAFVRGKLTTVSAWSCRYFSTT